MLSLFAVLSKAKYLRRQIHNPTLLVVATMTTTRDLFLLIKGALYNINQQRNENDELQRRTQS